MTCPAGYTWKDLEELNTRDEKQSDTDGEKMLPMITLYPPTAEPKIPLDIMPEPIIGMLSGQAAIMMQWLKYGFARGSVEHSNFAARVLQHEIETGRYMTVTVYDTYEEKAAITGLVHKVPQPVSKKG